MIKIIPYNETYIRVITNDLGLDQDLSTHFMFYAPGYKYQPKFKAGIWDGRIRLFNGSKKTIYKGLLMDVIKFCKDRELEFEVDISLNNKCDVSESIIRAYVDSLSLQARGVPLEVRPYQYEAVTKALTNKRQILVCPTSSGKSMIIYSIIRWHIEHGRKILIIVPTTMLVEQLFKDFIDYSTENGWNVEDNISTLYSGKERIFDKSVVISTWQSMASMMKTDKPKFTELINRTEVGVWDEAHTYKAAVVLSVMEEFTKTTYRVGTTGTIDDTKINSLTLSGLIGPIHKVITTKQLMDDNHVTKLKIDCLVLKYPEHICKAYKTMDYREEINFLVGYEARNQFIAKLASSIKGNTLVLFNFVDRHGEVLLNMIKAQSDKQTYFLHGDVPQAERERVRTEFNTQKDAIILASYGLMSTGVNIPSIENIIFAIPSKSSIRVRQSIGRGLRLNANKNVCNLYDIADDLQYKKSKNITLKHLEDRCIIYAKDNFEFTLKHLKLGTS